MREPVIKMGHSCKALLLVYAGKIRIIASSYRQFSHVNFDLPFPALPLYLGYLVYLHKFVCLSFRCLQVSLLSTQRPACPSCHTLRTLCLSLQRNSKTTKTHINASGCDD